MKKSVRFAAWLLSALLVWTACAPLALSETAPADGLYTVTVSSSSDMFRVVRCLLSVYDGNMTATLTLSGTGYGYLYAGTAADAAAAPKDEWIPFAEGFEGEYTYALPVSALDAELAVAAYSAKKETWYDRTLRFSAATLAPFDFVAPDGRYRLTAESGAAPLAGASCVLTARNGEMTVTLPVADGSVSALDLGAGEIAVQNGEVSFPVASLDKRLPIRLCVSGQWEDCWLSLNSASRAALDTCPEDGVYVIDVKSDSGLLRVSSCTLRVEGGEMRAELTASGASYDRLYAGSAASAPSDEGAWIPVQADADGAYSFAMGVRSLDAALPLATHSAAQNLWYDRELTFLSDTLCPVSSAAPSALADGEYVPDDFTVSGGTGRVAISCEKIMVSGSKATATVVFSSPNYTRVVACGNAYDAVKDGETASFEIPVTLNADNEIVATTTAMSKARDIAYVLRFTLGGAQADPSGAPEIPGLTFVSALPLSYAEGFRVYRYEGGYSLLEIRDGARFLTVPEGGAIPDALPENVAVLQKPVRNIYLAATSAMSLFDALDALDALRLTGTDVSGWYVDNAVSAMERGDILFAGKYSEPDFELLLREKCELAIESTMILHSPQVRELIELLGIPVLTDYSSYEPQPLGRTEWLKLYGALVGKEEAAEALFAKQAAMLEEFANLKGTGKTVAFFYIAQDGSVVVRNPSDYVAKTIALAGGKYAFDGVIDPSETRASVSITLEDFYAAAVNVDYLVYNATIDDAVSSVEELLAKAGGVLSDCKAVREGNVWRTGKTLYQATDRIGDLTRDFYAMLTGDGDGMTFLTKMR